MTKYARNQGTIASKLDDEVVMIDIDLGEYFSLNPVASSIWEYLETPKTEMEICDSLLEEYDIDEVTCSKEVHAFLAELQKRKLITTI